MRGRLVRRIHTTFVDMSRPRRYRRRPPEEVSRGPSGWISCVRARARQKVEEPHGLQRLGPGPPVDHTTPARRRRGVRPAVAVPTRVHEARHDRRPEHGLHRRRHRRLRRRPGRLVHRTGRRAAPSGGAASAIRLRWPDHLRRDPAPGRPCRPDHMQDLSTTTASSPSASNSSPRLDSATSDIGPGLATDGRPNDDNSVWTFKLRPASNGRTARTSPPTDVVATMDRLVAAGNCRSQGRHRQGLGGRLPTRTPSPSIFVSANGNFPYLVSVFNSQSPITPGGLRRPGPPLDALPNGTGPWNLRQLRPERCEVLAQ